MFESEIMQVKKSEEDQQAVILGRGSTPHIVHIDELAFFPSTDGSTPADTLSTKVEDPLTDDTIANKDENLSRVEQPATTEGLKFIVKDSIWFLDEAKRIQEERGATYDSTGGTKERSMGKTVAAFNAITGKDLTEAEGWLLLQLLKDARQWANPDVFHLDSAMDCVSYSSLKAEALAANK
jgi:hypothetical protein